MCFEIWASDISLDRAYSRQGLLFDTSLGSYSPSEKGVYIRVVTHQQAGSWSSLPYRAVLKEGMMGSRGRKVPAASWHVRPAWNSNTWGAGQGSKKK